MESKKYIIDGKEIEVYRATDVCSRCKGACCCTMGGHYSPQDFEDLSFEGLMKEIYKGKISIDWWESERGPEYYLRARNLFEPIVCGSWGGTCVNWNAESGCCLSWEERPLGCKVLKPGKKIVAGRPVGECYSTYLKEECKNEWSKYSDVLRALVNYYCGR